MPYEITEASPQQHN